MLHETPSHTVSTSTEPGQDYQEVLQAARRLYEQDPDWVTFFREVLGINGVIHQRFSDPSARNAFEQTDEWAEIQKMLARLRDTNSVPNSKEPTRVITVRLPQSLHESLKSEAHTRHTSMNQLCISKLLQMIDEGLIPTE